MFRYKSIIYQFIKKILTGKVFFADSFWFDMDIKATSKSNQSLKPMIKYKFHKPPGVSVNTTSSITKLLGMYRIENNQGFFEIAYLNIVKSFLHIN